MVIDKTYVIDSLIQEGKFSVKDYVFSHPEGFQNNVRKSLYEALWWIKLKLWSSTLFSNALCFSYKCNAF